MTKVYVVVADDYYREGIHGVFSTPEKAADAADKLMSIAGYQPDYYNVIEFELDGASLVEGPSIYWSTSDYRKKEEEHWRSVGRLDLVREMPFKRST